MGRVEIFLSYCWADEEIASDIEMHLAKDPEINLHRDKLDIRKWGSIKQYMQSIPKMDYMILLISDAYLKSANCMYEVLEVMRDRQYQDKIFPAVVHTGIYKPAIRASYVKHWRAEYEELKHDLEGIGIQNIGRLGEDLKRRQDISANIADFLDLVSDMNNPSISDVCTAIEEHLADKNIIRKSQRQSGAEHVSERIFESMGIFAGADNAEPTDLEINQFMSKAFHEINEIMVDLCKQLEEKYGCFQIMAEMIDSRNYYYQFYKNGRTIKSLKIFLDNSFGAWNIGFSNDSFSMVGGNHSWNGMYSAKCINGNLCLSSMMSLGGRQNGMTTEDVVKDIWKNHITPYLER